MENTNPKPEIASRPPYDPMRDLGNAAVRLTVVFPYFAGSKAVEMQIGHPLVEALTPLPRDREVLWCAESRVEAQRIMDLRQAAAIEIGRAFAAELLKIFGANDPQWGRAPEKLAKEYADKAVRAPGEKRG